MAVRGRPRKGQEVSKSAKITARVAPDLKAQLSAAAERNGLTLSQEIEKRLRRAAEEEPVMERLGGYKMYWLFRLFTLATQGIINPERPKKRHETLPEVILESFGDWSNDPYMFSQISQAINYILSAFRPQGEPTIPTGPDLSEKRRNWMGVLGAADVLEKTAAGGVPHLKLSPEVANTVNPHGYTFQYINDYYENLENKIYSAIHQDLGAAAKNLRIPGNLWKWRDLIREQDKLITEIATTEFLVEDP